MSKSVLRAGLIGLGFAAWDLKMPSYAALTGRVEISAVADPSPEARARARSELGIVDSACHANYRDLLARDDLDFVDISTPHVTHAEILVAAADAEMPFICDKPLAMSLAEADQVLGAAERSGVTAAVHRNFRFFPGYQKLWELLRAGAIGRPLSAHISATGITGWRLGASAWRPMARISGGGILIDYGMHGIYLVREALGAGRPDRVSAFVDRGGFAGGDVEDSATLVLAWDSGARATIDLSWGSGPNGQTVVHGETGALRLLYDSGRSAPHHVAQAVSHLSGRSDEQLHELSWQRDPMNWYYRGGIEAFVDALAGAKSDAASLADGRADLEIALAAYQSAAVGSPVALPLSPTSPVYQRGVLGIRDLDLPANSVVHKHGLFDATA